MEQELLDLNTQIESCTNKCQLAIAYTALICVANKYNLTFSDPEIEVTYNLYRKMFWKFEV